MSSCFSILGEQGARCVFINFFLNLFKIPILCSAFRLLFFISLTEETDEVASKLFFIL